MLYDILIVLLVVYAMLTPFFIVKSIKFGILLGQKPEEVHKIRDFVKLPKRKSKKDKAREKELEKIGDILSNIEAYDGTGMGQKEIK